MTAVLLSEMCVSQLVKEFVELGIAQGQAWRIMDVEEFNRLYDLIEAIIEELKGRDGDMRRPLIPLYTHPVIRVRLTAARRTLALEPEKARRVVQDIADSKYSESPDAGMCLFQLDRGAFIPT
jgi:hypothetical protein